jgi:hypothetical protein
MKPGGQRKQESQFGEQQKDGDTIINFNQSHCKPVESISSNSNNYNNSRSKNSKSVKTNTPGASYRANVSAAPWLTKEVDESRKGNLQCMCCGSGDNTIYWCTIYTRQHAASQSTN